MRFRPGALLRKMVGSDEAKEPPAPLVQATAGSGPTFRVLCIGDSMTRGYIEGQSKPHGIYHPYSLRLQQRLQEHMGAAAQVDTYGLNGLGVYQLGWTDTEQTQFTLQPYLEHAISQAAAHGAAYDYVIILCGVNDLSSGTKGAYDIIPGLQKAYETAIQAGATVIAIPPLPNLWVPQHSKADNQRRQIGAGIKEYAASAPWVGYAGVTVLDLEETGTLDFYAMPQDKREYMMCDPLHLTAAGYDIFGDLVFTYLAKTPRYQAALAAIHGTLPAS